MFLLLDFVTKKMNVLHKVNIYLKGVNTCFVEQVRYEKRL